MTVFEKIEAQQKGKEDTAVWMVGEQLKDICRHDPHCAEIVAADLDNPDLSLEAAEKKIKAKADEIHKKNTKSSRACVPPNVAERIIRDFYGLPAAGNPSTAAVPKPAAAAPKENAFLDLEDFL